jgi:hypothetical protein
MGWIQRLNLERDFAEIWREAFPGEDLPAMAAR